MTTVIRTSLSKQHKDCTNCDKHIHIGERIYFGERIVGHICENCMEAKNKK